jgi:Domain of unknown function (DUF3846)
MQSVIIAASGNSTLADLTTLKELQAVVGGCIEVIHLGDCDLFINEDGIAADLPCNPRATRFAKLRLNRMERILLSEDGWILGNVIVAGLSDANGNGTDLSVEIVRELTEW